jgi:isocitrate dehydrogenase
MAVSYNGVSVPSEGKNIAYANGKYDVPDNPIIPFIEGDGTGRDIWKASLRIFDAAIEKAYKGKRRVAKRNSTTGCPTTPWTPSANFA